MYYGTVSELFGERVRRLRNEKSLSAAQLSRLVGIGENGIRKIENGDTKEPTFSTGVRLANALGVSPSELAFGTGSQGGPANSIDDEFVSVADVAREIGNKSPMHFGEEELEQKIRSFQELSVRHGLESLFCAIGPDYVRAGGPPLAEVIAFTQQYLLGLKTVVVALAEAMNTAKDSNVNQLLRDIEGLQANRERAAASVNAQDHPQ